MISRAVDGIIAAFFPQRALIRAQARATLQQIAAFGGGAGGYDAGKNNRLTQGRVVGGVTENTIPDGQINRLRYSAWDLFRNNPHARKIVRTLESKVIGKGPRPISAARKLDGSPHVEFRNRAQRLWGDVAAELDYRGKPGRGGQSITGLGKSALRSVILGGDAIYRFRDLSTASQMRKQLRIPLQVQLIHAERLDGDYSAQPSDENVIHRGVEVDADSIAVAFHIRNMLPSGISTDSVRVPASEIGHVFVADDVDQIRGTSWFASVLMQSRDTSDYQYNELKASAIASCVALGIRRPRGIGVGGFGTQLPQNWSLTDVDGNPLTGMQPGMIVDLGADGELVMANPSRPSTNAEAWIQHLIRSTAAGLPGIKSSTLTGDYRNSSFSSERSADNDAWPEIEGVQCWFYESFYQPIYEAVITAGVSAGYFGDVITADEFAQHRAELLAADWQGPVALSINPVDDIKAAADRIAAGLSTPQIEAAKLGNNWREILRQFKEFNEAAGSESLAVNLIEQWLGLDPTVNAQDTSAGASDAQP